MRNGPYELVVAPADWPGKRYRGRYCYEHHLVWWQHTGSLPKDGYVIHHRNKNKRDNRIENLEEKGRAEHTAEHNQVDVLDLLCTWCGKKIELKPHRYRSRVRASRYGKVFCSRSCGAKHQYSKVSQW